MRWLLLIPALLLAACSLVGDGEQRDYVARVHDYYLYPETIEALVPPGTNSTDSLTIVQSFVQQWVQEKLQLHIAELNLPEEQQDVSQQLEDYRTSLIIYEYQKELIRQKLDTSVTQAEVLRYYDAHKQNFELKDYILRGMYMQLEANSPNVEEVVEWFNSDEVEDQNRLDEYAQTYAAAYHADRQAWLYLDEVTAAIPVNPESKLEYLQSNGRFQLQDSTHLYLLHVLDYQMKDSISPVELEAENIRNIIVNERKLSLLNDMKKDIFENARRNGDFEIKLKAE